MSIQTPMLSPDQLSPSDEEILDVLQGGRGTAPYIADEIDSSNGHVRNRLRRLEEHDHVTRVYEGLYELKTDPREEGDLDAF